MSSSENGKDEYVFLFISMDYITGSVGKIFAAADVIPGDPGIMRPGINPASLYRRGFPLPRE